MARKVVVIKSEETTGGAAMEFRRSERIALRLHPELNEKWVQGLIALDPSIIGLGDLVLERRSVFNHQLVDLIFFYRIWRRNAVTR